MKTKPVRSRSAADPRRERRRLRAAVRGRRLRAAGARPERPRGLVWGTVCSDFLAQWVLVPVWPVWLV